MTLAALTATFSDLLSQDVEYVQLPLEEYLETFPAPMRPLFRWYDEYGYKVDTESLRKEYPELMTLVQYLKETGWENWQAPD